MRSKAPLNPCAAPSSLWNPSTSSWPTTITSPISGTIIDKNYKAGETSESNQVLCSIYDLSYLTMTLSVDELDIADIAVGQTVSITADAVDDQTYKGVVTKVSVAAIPDAFADTSGADALAANILDGKTAFVNGVKVTGSMPDNGSATATMDGLTTTSVTIPAGYTSGGTVSLTADIEEALAAI